MGRTVAESMSWFAVEVWMLRNGATAMGRTAAWLRTATVRATGVMASRAAYMLAVLRPVFA